MLVLLKNRKIQTLAPELQHQNPGLQCPQMRIVGKIFVGLVWHPSVSIQRKTSINFFCWSPQKLVPFGRLGLPSEVWQGGYKVRGCSFGQASFWPVIREAAGRHLEKQLKLNIYGRNVEREGKATWHCPYTDSVLEDRSMAKHSYP